MQKIWLIIAGCLIPFLAAAADLRNTVDGTVTDLKTGLIWQQSEGGEMSWEDAIAYCNKLSIAGHNDWRLPSSAELQSLFAYKKRFPSGYARVFSKAAAASYWSSSPHAFHGGIAWAVDFRNGDNVFNIKSSRLFVRAVRSGN